MGQLNRSPPTTWRPSAPSSPGRRSSRKRRRSLAAARSVARKPGRTSSPCILRRGQIRRRA